MPSYGVSCPECGASGTQWVRLRTLTESTRPPHVGPETCQSLPRFGELLLYILLTRTERINLLGDLNEDYNEAYFRFGKTAALSCFYAQVLRSLWPLFWRVLVRVGAISAASQVSGWL